MKLLIVAATKEEIQPFCEWFTSKSSSGEILITGAGMVPTAFAIGKKLSEKSYDILLNVGIAGSFSKKLPLGSVLRVNEDCFSELGVEDDNEFISSDDLNLGTSCFQENPGILVQLNTITSLPLAKAITVNQVHGNEKSIQQIQTRISPTIETMEGAAVFYAAKQAGILSLQVRGISNFIEKRNKNNWDIPIAIQNLNNWLIGFMKEFSIYTNK